MSQTKKFRITSPRYIDGEYVRASPDAPVEIELPVATKARHDMQPVEVPQEKLKPAHHVAQSSAVQQSHEAAKTPPQTGKGKRANDADPLG